MNDRTKFIGAWVSKEEKQEIVRIAKARNTSVSGLIRQCVIRPMMTLPDVTQSVKTHIDSKFKKLENVLKNQLFAREPIRRTIIEEYGTPIERLRPPPQIVDVTPQRLGMAKVMKQMKKVLSGEEEFALKEISEEEIGKRAKTDHDSYIEFKEKAMKRKLLFQPT